MRDMEESVAAPSCYNKDLSPIAKGKRTKRYRPHSPIPFTITIAATNHRFSPTVSTTSSEETTTTEEEDTARCLILLANSHFEHKKRHLEAGEAAAGSGAGGTCMYVCKTCDRAFSSFQALGGHRASHKKLKHEKCNISDNVKKITDNMWRMETLPLPRMHECSYCGAEFTSGQALGGHMRRHRAAPISPPSDQVSIEEPEPEESKKPRNGLCLDLNLPAQEVENQGFGFNSRRQKSQEKLALSAAAAK